MGREVRNVTQITLRERPSTAVAGIVVADLCALAVYVAVGRASHDESLSAAGLLTTAWPFVIGLAGGYLGAAMVDWPLTSLRGGAVITGKCLIIGLVLRYGVQREGTPFSFILVTVLVLTVLMQGWRLTLLAWSRRREPQPALNQNAI